MEASTVEAGSLTKAVVALVSLQTLFMWADEWIYHRRRGLESWERWGHPLDSLAYVSALVLPAFAPPQPFWVQLYIILAIFSALITTKDEWVHAAKCAAGEHWVHAVLFLVHPSILIFVGYLWLAGDGFGLRKVLPGLVGIFTCYQIARWCAISKPARGKTEIRP